MNKHRACQILITAGVISQVAVDHYLGQTLGILATLLWIWER